MTRNTFTNFPPLCVQAPELNWVTVLDNLDHEGFYIPDEAAFSFLMSIYKHACQVPPFFPLYNACICEAIHFSPF